MPKQFLKMADAFPVLISADELSATFVHPKAKYAAHAINSHDELVRQRDELLAAMKTIANSEEFHGDSFICDFDSLQSVARATISNLNLNTKDGHSPDTGKMVKDGWQLVPVEPTAAMLDEFDSIVDFGSEDSKDAWSRMLAAAPKLGGE